MARRALKAWTPQYQADFRARLAGKLGPALNLLYSAVSKGTLTVANPTGGTAERDITPSMVRAAEILIGKVVPDLTNLDATVLLQDRTAISEQELTGRLIGLLARRPEIANQLAQYVPRDRLLALAGPLTVDMEPLAEGELGEGTIGEGYQGEAVAYPLDQDLVGATTGDQEDPTL